MSDADEAWDKWYATESRRYGGDPRNVYGHAQVFSAGYEAAKNKLAAELDKCRAELLLAKADRDDVLKRFNAEWEQVCALSKRLAAVEALAKKWEKPREDWEGEVMGDCAKELQEVLRK